MKTPSEENVARMQISIESLGRGVVRIGAANVGYADVQAVYSKCGWDVEVQRTNITDQAQLTALLDEYRKAERLLEV